MTFDVAKIKLTFVSDDIEAYSVAHTTPLPPLAEELIAATMDRVPPPMSIMGAGQTVGTMLQVLVASTGARKVLDIGTFTGFSALMMAGGLPEDGRVITLELNPTFAAIAQEFFGRSPHGHKIDLRVGPALEAIESLEGPFDFVFLDADKDNYINYYEAVLPKLAPNGLIAVDNVLLMGTVLDPTNDLSKAIIAFDDHVQKDDRVTNVTLTVRDGVMLIRRKM